MMKLGGASLGVFVTLTVAFQAGVTLGLSSALATNVYFALSVLAWAGAAAAIVSSFGIGAALAGTVFGLVKGWALKKFVAW